MGAYNSIFEPETQEKKIRLSPSKGDWITGHADLTGLAVVEVQRFWIRFKQLNCDEKGFLPKKQIEKGELSKDILTKNIIANLPKEKDGSLSFLVFLKFMQWIDSASIEQKLKLIFHFLNNGDDITQDVVEKLVNISSKNDNLDNKELNSIVKLFMEQLDPNNTNKIDEKSFIGNIFANYEREELDFYLKYNLIPDDLLNELKMQPSQSGSQLNMRNTNTTDNNKNLSDDLLESVAKKVVKRDWEKLAIRLGYTEKKIQLYSSKYNNSFDTILALMLDWRDDNPNLETKNKLREYLEDLRMNDAAVLLR